VRGLHPKDCAVPSETSRYSIDRRYVDLGLGQLGDDIGYSPDSIIPLNKEACFRPHQLQLGLFGGGLERYRVSRDKIDL